MERVWGYGELILCEQDKPEGSIWIDRGPCEIAKEKEFFTTDMTATKDCHIVKMQKKCAECSCNKGKVDVFWKLQGS